jgi:hypothetical protein
MVNIVTAIMSAASNSPTPSALELASRTHKNIFLGYMCWLAVAAIATLFFTWALWKSSNRRQEASKTEADLRVLKVEETVAESKKAAAEANRIAEEERLARVKLEAKLAKRSSLMSQAQQNELTARLSKFTGQRGTIIASPSTPESEWFVMVLGAPLKAAGWDITPLRGTSTATVLYPTGVVIGYPFTGKTIPDPEPHAELAKALNEWGISATVTSSPLREGNTIEIIVSER